MNKGIVDMSTADDDDDDDDGPNTLLKSESSAASTPALTKYKSSLVGMDRAAVASSLEEDE